MPSIVECAQDTMFARLDSNHDGRVTHAELVAAVAPSVAGWPEAALLPDAIMRFGDGTGRGWICLHEFQALAAMLRGNLRLRTELGIGYES